jgi:hypothetical protein
MRGDGVDHGLRLANPRKDEPMSIWSLGLHHSTAPLDFRGRFALPADRLEPLLQDLQRRLTGRPEVAVLSTCNRTEIYCAGSHEDVEPALDWLAACGNVSAADLRQRAFTLQDGPAARHAFRVASGLDSMVLGEPQILGQFKGAVRAAEARRRARPHAATSCSSGASRSPRKCAAPPTSARIPSASPRLQCGWPASSSPTWVTAACCSSAPAR